MKIKIRLQMVVAFFLLAGCAHGGTSNKLDEKMSSESGIQTRADLHSETSGILDSARLTPEQREQLKKLGQNLHSQEKEIWQASLKLRAILVKDLLADKYNPNEIQTIKNRMWDLENKRLSLIYGAIDQASQILGHFAPEDQPMINQFFESNSIE